MSRQDGRLGGGELWVVSYRAHVLFKWAIVIGSEVACAGFTYVDAVEALYWAVA